MHSIKKKLVGNMDGCGILVISMLVLGLYIYKRREVMRVEGEVILPHILTTNDHRYEYQI